jgi:hypothetical protein
VRKAAIDMLSPHQRLRIIVGGLVGQYPLGGVAWDYFHYVLALHELGHDVYYDENTNTWPYDPIGPGFTDDCSFTVQFIGDFFRRYAPALQENWQYRLLVKDSFGMTTKKFDEIAATADVYLNVSGACLIPEKLNSRCIKVFMDTDPGYAQIGLHTLIEEEGPRARRYLEVKAHDRFFTYAENIWSDDCKLPRLGLPWQTTRPVVTLNHWADVRRQLPKDTAMTTVMTLNFTEQAKAYRYNGVNYYDKRAEFEKFLDLPQRTTVPLRLAVGSLADLERVTLRGWQLIPAYRVSKTPELYKQFIGDSAGEWSIAKNFYVATRSGWFSCRTGCYLAAGRPAVVQDTGWSRFVPSGRGVFAFSTIDEAVESLYQAHSNPKVHRDAAYELAREYLSPDAVCTPMLEAIFAGPNTMVGQSQ